MNKEKWAHGFGFRGWEDGFYIEIGHYNEGKLEGFGRRVYHNLLVIEGMFKNDEPHGFGISM